MTSEQVFDILPNVSSILTILDIKGYQDKIAKENKGKKLDAQAMGIEFISYILTNTPKFKEDFFAIVAVAESKTVSEVKAQNFGQTIKTFKDLFNDPDLKSFFSQAIQSGATV